MRRGRNYNGLTDNLNDIGKTMRRLLIQTAIATLAFTASAHADEQVRTLKPFTAIDSK
eukprot:gene1998-2340_t